MAEKWITAGAAIAIAIVGLATIAVLVSRGGQTGDVLTGGAGAFRNALCAALSPIGVKCGESVTSIITFPGQTEPVPSVDSNIKFPPAGSTTLPGYRFTNPGIGEG
jgi:hypothetical protein